MTSIELYINSQLCDIKDPQNLGVRLNRVLISPAELTMKDAQYSYSVTIPTTTINDSIFGYTNVEEVKSKFNQSYSAQLYVDGVCVFDGQFRVTEIDAEGNYKGNLLIPVPKTVKELFGEKKMNQIGDWKFYLTQSGNENDEPMGMVEMLNKINAAKGIPDCIFPLVLYGLLPKVAKDEEGNYSEKDIWDETVRLGIEDFAPSINCLQTIKKIFENYKDANGKSYQIGGSAFNDPRLLNLYMSYSNPTDYEQQWNWEHLGSMEITGEWYNAQGIKPINNLEYNYYQIDQDQDKTKCVAVNLFSAKNSKITILKDNGYNIYQYSTKKNGYKINNTSLKIPVSGLYKIEFRGTMELQGSTTRGGTSSKDSGLRFVHANENVEDVSIVFDEKIKSDNLFHNLRGELKLVRTRGNDGLDMTTQGIDGLFFKENFNQIDDRNDQYQTIDQNKKFQKFNTYPKYFPQEDSVLWIDPAQNKNFICGLHWGKTHFSINSQRNPIDSREVPTYVMAAKSGISWNADNDDVNYCVTNSSEYWTYQVINENLEEEDTPDANDLGYVKEGKLKMDLIDLTEKNSTSTSYSNYSLNEEGAGNVSVIMWLDKGDQLAVIDVTDKGTWHSQPMQTYVKHASTFHLKIDPYKKTTDWAKVKMDGTGISSMKWGEMSDFSKNYINLSDFLPSEQKIDEWLENFCKAFNLDLLQPQEGQFQLNLKKSVSNDMVGSVLNLDDKVSLFKRTNQPLNLPSQIEVSFKVDEEEEGYDYYIRNPKEGIADNGLGKIVTGSLFGNSLTQNSSFSYNWFKIIKCNVFNKDLAAKTPQNICLPIISNKEIWSSPNGKNDYSEMMTKIYTNYSQRFWYRSDKIYNLGPVRLNRYLNETDNFIDQHQSLYIYPLSNTYISNNGNDKLILNYHDEADSILRSYFTLITSEDSNYTLVECYLTPDEYEQLSFGKLVSINSDLYYVSSIENYDPTGKNQTKLKLIRKT